MNVGIHTVGPNRKFRYSVDQLPIKNRFIVIIFKLLLLLNLDGLIRITNLTIK